MTSNRSAPGTLSPEPETGLTASEAAAKLGRDAPNTMPAAPAPSPIRLLLRQMVNFFALMLWVAAVLAVIGAMRQLGIAIGIVVLLNGAFAFAQEYRADRAAARLRDLLPAQVRVVRDGSLTMVPRPNWWSGTSCCSTPATRSAPTYG